MAIQNFLSGGFYGSIGELTGRRWKNKRVVQAKFKPKNPKTPAQEAQRRLFTRGSALAKIAQQVNWHAPQFENPIRTDWNQRQTVAINALKNGKTEWEALPLAPEKFKANHIIGECTLTGISEDKKASFEISGTDLLQNKKYACAIFITSGEKTGQIIVGSGTTDEGSAENITLRLPETEGILDEECYIKIASYDDEEIETVTLSAGIYLKQRTLPPYEFDVNYEGVDYSTSGTLTIKIKIGNEAIESYKAMKNYTARIYGHYWTKATYIRDGKMDETNATAIDRLLVLDKYSVAKSSATVTLYSTESFFNTVEKWNTKLDINFEAQDVKAENTLETSENIQLLAQEFPEYLPNIPKTQPYSFNVTMGTVTSNNNGTFTVSVKIGNEAITNYDPFTDTKIVLTGSVWTKQAYITNGSMTTGNATSINQTLTITNTSVNTSTATITFVCSVANAYLYEKYSAKLNITINAKNVQSATTIKNSQTLTLNNQNFVEYLQPVCSITNPQNLIIRANTNQRINGEWVMTGTAFAINSQNDNGQMIYISQDFESYEENYDGLTRINNQNGKVYSGDELEELIGDNGFSYVISGATIGWGIADENIKDFAGTLKSDLLIENGKIAFKGYRVVNIPKNSYNDTTINITFTK